MNCKNCICYDMCEILPFTEDVGEKCEREEVEKAIKSDKT